MSELFHVSHEVPRRAYDVATSAMHDFGVVVLQGPRAVGKSTLLRALANQHVQAVVDLDDPITRESVQREPTVYAGATRPVFLDEFQHAPEVLDAIKAELNRDGAPGRFVLTSSARYGSLPLTAQSLTGRVRLVDVLPLSIGEASERTETFVAALLADPRSVGDDTPSRTTREEYAERITAGGFPLALQLPTRAARLTWFDEYMALVLSRDVLELSRIRQRRALPLLLARLAAQTGGVLNLAEAASAVELDKGTADDYLQLLEAVFLLRRIPAWGSTLGARVAKASKIHVVDSGVAARLLRLTPAALTAANPTALSQFGHLLETFVVGELLKQVSWLETPVDIGHFRTRDGEEVDLVLERPDGTVIGVEVKASARPTGAEKGFAALRKKAGSLFAGGILLYLGDRPIRVAEDVVAVPVDRLWSGPG